MENEDVKKLVNAVGASAELVGILNKSLLTAGFTKKDSLYLCGEVLKAMFTERDKKE